MSLALPGAAFAADSPSPFDACMNSARSTPEFTSCSQAEMARQDKLLNDVWHRVSDKMKSNDMNSFDLLLNEQRKWIQWKDASCLYYMENFGSEGRSIQYPMCLIRILKDRVAYLTELADEQ